jgi:hypothetical protein
MVAHKEDILAHTTLECVVSDSVQAQDSSPKISDTTEARRHGEQDGGDGKAERTWKRCRSPNQIVGVLGEEPLLCFLQSIGTFFCS